MKRLNSRTGSFKRVLAAASISAVLIAVTMNALFPLFYMLSTALKTKAEYLNNLWGFPEHPTLDNFTRIIAGQSFLTMFKNSLIVTLGSAIVGTFVASLAAYAFAKMRFHGRNVLMAINIALMSLPAIVMVVPLFVLLTTLRMVNTYPAPIIIYIGIMIPMSVFLLTSFFRNVPWELIAAARLDGCSTFGTFIWIILPICQPALAVIFIVNSLWVWNDLLIALLFLQDESKRTLMVGVSSFQGRMEVDVPLLMAALFIAALPMFALYMAGQRFFIKGLIEGAIKE